jgi:hypothetical protein
VEEGDASIGLSRSPFITAAHTALCFLTWYSFTSSGALEGRALPLCCCACSQAGGKQGPTCLCHLPKCVLCATAHHVMLPNACYLPVNCLLTTWPATPVPCSPLMKSGVSTMTPANPGCSPCSASHSCCSLLSQLPVHGTDARRHRAPDDFVRSVGPASLGSLLSVGAAVFSEFRG